MLFSVDVFVRVGCGDGCFEQHALLQHARKRRLLQLLRAHHIDYRPLLRRATSLFSIKSLRCKQVLFTKNNFTIPLMLCL